MDGLVDLDPRLTLTQYQLLYGDPAGPPDRFVQAALGATTSGDVTAFTDHHRVRDQPAEAPELVEDLRAAERPARAAGGPDSPGGGGAADVVDVVDRIAADFPRTAACSSSSPPILVLFVLLRSMVLPAQGAGHEHASRSRSRFGALVWIFQDGNLSAILGFQPLGFVETTQPVILFCVLFGLSMDYEVFLLSRMREIWDRTRRQPRGGRPRPRAERPDRDVAPR